MFLLIHVLIGILLALNIDNPLLLTLAILASHFLLDIIPHWDSYFDEQMRKNYKENNYFKIMPLNIFITTLDYLISLVTTIYYYIQFNRPIILFAAFLASLPDIIQWLYVTRFKRNKWFNKYMRFHMLMQYRHNPGIIKGLAIQLITIILLLILIRI